MEDEEEISIDAPGFEEEDEEIAVSAPPAMAPSLTPDDISSVYSQAAQLLRQQRQGLSTREKLGALLIGAAQPTRGGRWQDMVVNAGSSLAQRTLSSRKEEEARRQQLAGLLLKSKLADKQIAGRERLEQIKAQNRLDLAAKKPPALQPITAYDDTKNPLNPFTGQPMAKGMVVDRQGNMLSLADLQKKYGPTFGASEPAPAAKAAPAEAPTPDIVGGDKVIEIGGIQFLEKPDGTRVKLGEKPETFRPAKPEEARQQGTTAGQVSTKTGKFEAAKEAKTVVEEEKEQRAAAEALAKTKRVITDIDGVLGKVGPLNTGIIGAVTKGIPSSPAFNLRELIKPIQANLGFDELAKMRAASPTGGALGQVAVKELDYLQAAVASLEQAQSTDQMVDALKRVKNHYQRWQATLVKAQRQTTGASARPERRVPTRVEFLSAARKANPGMSDAQLNAYYNQKYGGGL